MLKYIVFNYQDCTTVNVNYYSYFTIIAEPESTAKLPGTLILNENGLAGHVPPQ